MESKELRRAKSLEPNFFTLYRQWFKKYWVNFPPLNVEWDILQSILTKKNLFSNWKKKMIAVILFCFSVILPAKGGITNYFRVMLISVKEQKNIYLTLEISLIILIRDPTKPLDFQNDFIQFFLCSTVIIEPIQINWAIVRCWDVRSTPPFLPPSCQFLNPSSPLLNKSLVDFAISIIKRWD